MSVAQRGHPNPDAPDQGDEAYYYNDEKTVIGIATSFTDFSQLSELCLDINMSSRYALMHENHY